MLRETQHGEVADGTAKTTPATSTPGPGNRALAASSNRGALARAIAGQGLGNRATRALIARDGLFPQSAADLHEQVYGDSSLAHAPSPEPKYEFSDDPLDADWEPDKSIRVKPGPVRTTFIKALLQTAKGKKFEIPPAPPATRTPDWTRQPDFQPSPGQVIIPGPVWRW